MPEIEQQKNRKLPVQIDCPIYKTDTITYEIPDGYKLHKNKDYYSVRNKFGEFDFNIYEEDDKIMVVKRVLIKAGTYPLSEYSDFYDFYNSILDIENKTHLSLSK